MPSSIFLVLNAPSNYFNEYKKTTIMNDDIQFQIECISTELIQLLMETYSWDIRKSLDELYSSETYARLNDPECGLYYESAVYVFSFLKNEIETGRIA